MTQGEDHEGQPNTGFQSNKTPEYQITEKNKRIITTPKPINRSQDLTHFMWHQKC